MLKRKPKKKTKNNASFEGREQKYAVTEFY